jgi:hypothetical protein
VSLYRVRTVIQGVQGLPGLNTHYFIATGAGTTAEATTCAGRVRAAWAAVAPSMPNGVTIQVQGQVDLIDTPTGNLAGSFSIAPPALVGGSGGVNLGAPQVAGGIVWDTTVIVANRRLRGRTFVSPLFGGAVGAGAPVAPLPANLAAYSTALLTASPPATAPAAVWSRPIAAGKPGGPRAGSSFPILVGTAASKWYTLRSRLN